MILGANHVAISVPDMKKAKSFYVDLLRLEKTGEFSRQAFPAGLTSPDSGYVP